MAKARPKKATKVAPPTPAPKAGAKAKATAAKPVSGTVLSWQDDPISGWGVFSGPAPNLGKAPALDFPGLPAAGTFPIGTDEFRRMSTAVALRRAADFWKGAVGNLTWHPSVGNSLRINFDDGVDLNAFYDRQSLSFFHATTTNGSVVFSGESPDVACHELGHAVLDAIRPQLWDAASVEAAAFHESFGDMSSLLTALQLPSVRASVLHETGNKLYASSRLSRLAEQLAAAIREQFPQLVAADCLRNAVNSFFYKDPLTLPPSGPDWQLTSEPHSFSRVFTSAFFEALAGMVETLAPGNVDKSSALAQATLDMGGILVAGVRSAPIVSIYYSSVAAHMIAADGAQTNGKYRDALKSAFVRHGVLGLQESMNIPSGRAAGKVTRAARGAVAAAGDQLPGLRLAAASYGLAGAHLEVNTPNENVRLAAGPAVVGATAAATPPRHEQAAEEFVRFLFTRGRVDIGAHGHRETRVAHPFVRTKTHEVVKSGDSVRLQRTRFDCGFD